MIRWKLNVHFGYLDYTIEFDEPHTATNVAKTLLSLKCVDKADDEYYSPKVSVEAVFDEDDEEGDDF